MICISTRSPATVVSWMKDGVIIDESSTDHTLTQTITDRATSTYSNVVTVNEGVTTGVAGTYICNVSNELGSDCKDVVAVGELMVDVFISVSCLSLYISGISISGVQDPLTVGQSGTISCMTNIAVDSIEWWNQSSQLIISNATDLMELQYTIDLVTDDLQGQQFTCIAIAGDATYNEIVNIQVQGIIMMCSHTHIYPHDL